jgi:hypothetical protein
MKKLFALLTLLTCFSIKAHAQISYANIPVLDPSSVVIMQPTLLSTFTPGVAKVFIVNVPLNTSALELSTTPTPNSDTIILAVSCTADANAPDTGVFQNPARSISYSQTGNNNIPTYGSNQTIQLTIGQGIAIGIPTFGCSRLALQFFSSTGTLSDTLKIQGQFSNLSAYPNTLGGIPSYLNFGLNTATGFPIPLALTTSGAMIVAGPIQNGATGTGTQFPVLIGGQDSSGTARIAAMNTQGDLVMGANTVGADGISVNGTAQIYCTNVSTTTCPLQVAQESFNGSFWDRLVKCPTAVPITLTAAGTQQIVAPSAGKARVCGLFLEVSTGGTMTITEGTGATCGTGSTNVSGAMTLPVGAAPILTAGSSVMQTNTTGDGLCLVSGTAVAAGWAQVESH